jgi:hypothetical protein
MSEIRIDNNLKNVSTEKLLRNNFPDIQEEPEILDCFISDDNDNKIKTNINGQKKDNTILAYLDGQSELEGPTSLNFLKIEESGSDKKTNVIAQLGRETQENKINLLKSLGFEDADKAYIDGDWSGFRRYYVDHSPGASSLKNWPQEDLKIHSEVLENNPEGMMSDSSEFERFLEDGMREYPAETVTVIVSGHGGGGIFGNPITGSIVSLDQFGNAIKNSVNNHNQNLDLLVFDSCLMHSVETLHEVSDSVNYSVGSPKNVTSYNMPYDDLIDTIKNEDENIENAALKLTSDLINSDVSETVSMVDLSGFPELVDNIGSFSSELLKSGEDGDAIKKTFDRIDKSYGESGDFPQNDYSIDLYEIASHFYEDRNTFKNKEIGELAGNIMENIKANVHTENQENSSHSGLAIFMPLSIRRGVDEKSVRQEYFKEAKRDFGNIDFYQDTGWDRVISEYFL